MPSECRLRIDPVLVYKFQRLPGGINEVGVKIVRDLGLKYTYDKHSGNFDIIGDNPEILNIAIETLRFWVEDDDFPSTGITCQVGYPNKCNVIWRFHGDYAKKLDHLFPNEIAKIKQIQTVYVKAVPSKRNPDYVEVYCHFSVYNHVTDLVNQLSWELSRISQEDFFVPFSDYTKARRFARHKADDKSVLYALKEFPERNRVRVWIFGREHIDVIRARKEWIQHVGNISGDDEEPVNRENGVNSARFYGHPSASTSRDSNRELPNSPRSKKTVQTSHNLSVKSVSTSKTRKNSMFNGVKIPTFDNSNYPRPSNFVYPVDRPTVPEPLMSDDLAYYSNPFNLNELNDITEENPVTSRENSVIGKSGWEKGSGAKYPSKHRGKLPPNRIYVHHQVHGSLNSNAQTTDLALKQVIHPETNLMPGERFKTRQSERVLTSVTDPKFAPSLKKNKNMRPGVKKQLQPKVMAFTRQKPVAQSKQAQNIRYHINVNGLEIYMYKHNLVKLNGMDAIVNTVNAEIKAGGHLATNVLDMAGPQVHDEIQVYLNIYGPLRVAENTVTSAGRLPVLGIIHVAAPIWENYLNISEEECARDLHKAIYSSLKTAEKHKYRKVGMSVISSDPYYGVPKDLIAEVYVKALVDYSMGMGPLYPVLEIHLVDMEAEMLTYIKDAYEKWATDYNMVEVTQHLKSELPSQQELSERAQSAVTLKELPSHRSENMVTFMEQSYTVEGNQMWTFDVLKKIVVHVYTGSIVRLKDVEAIVTGVNSNLKGSLAKQMLIKGGTSYEVALKRARGDRDLIEGDVLVSEAGDLEADLVFHSIVTQPILKINEKNLVRLDRIYSQILQAANKLGIQSLAMPLIGTGQLRQKFEVEQCSLQLIDNVIEVCLSQGKFCKIKELHLVNVNPIMTQSLTQALRTRAHTKLRVESDHHPPSRTEVLSMPDNTPAIPELKQTSLSAREAPADDIAEEFKQLADMRRRSTNRKRQFDNIEELNKKITRREQREKGTVEDEKETEIMTVEEATAEQDTDMLIADKPGEINSADDNNELAMVNRNESVYLSKQILRQHERMIGSSSELTNEAGVKNKADGKDRLPDIRRSENDKSHHTKHNKQEKNNSDNKTTSHTKNEKLFKPPKPRKRRRLPPISGLVPQSSRAESYRSIYIRRQQVAAQMIKEQQVTIRRSNSTANIHDDTNVPDELKRKTVKKLKSKPVKGGDDEDPAEKAHGEKLRRDSESYFTRGTKDRYKSHKPEFRTDIPTSKSVDKDKRGSEFGILRQNKENLTDRAGMDRNPARKRVNERILWDKEREDMYMKEIDMFTMATNETENVTAEGASMKGSEEASRYGDPNEKDDARDEIRNGESSIRDVEYTQHKAEPTQPYQPKSSSTKTSDNYTESSFKETEIQPPGSNSERHESFHGIQNPATAQQEQPLLFESDVSSRSPRRKSSLKEDGLPLLENNQHIEENTPVLSELREPDSQHRDSITTMTSRSAGTSATKSKPIKLIISSEVIPKGNQHSNSGNSGTDKEGNLPVDGSKTNRLTNQSAVTPRAGDVTIRDKLTVEIDVQDRDRESSNVTREKAKIRRFWEVVGRKEVEDEGGLYGEENQTDNEKILMTRVKKERKMSARSKSSKLSEGTSVTSKKIGKYNVTVEVV